MKSQLREFAKFTAGQSEVICGVNLRNCTLKGLLKVQIDSK